MTAALAGATPRISIRSGRRPSSASRMARPTSARVRPEPRSPLTRRDRPCQAATARWAAVRPSGAAGTSLGYEWMVTPPMTLDADWLSACRRAAEGLASVLAAAPTTRERAVEIGRGEGGDRTLVIDRDA